jgi:hypothetical protein
LRAEAAFFVAGLAFAADFVGRAGRGASARPAFNAAAY